MRRTRFPFHDVHVANDAVAPPSAAALTAPGAGESPPWFDPGWLIRRTLTTEAAALPGTAEDALLVWLLRLSPEIDPSEAASRVLRVYRPARAPGDPLAQRLFSLLEETRAYTPARLARVHAARRSGQRGDA